MTQTRMNWTGRTRFASGGGVRGVFPFGEVGLRVNMFPPLFQGWAVARLVSPKVAVVIREADDLERQRLLKQWPQVSLQVCHASSIGVLAVRLTDNATRSI